MVSQRFPDAMVERFRKLALERIDRLEAGWQTLCRGAGNAELAAQVLRDLHTMKGDSRVMGFGEVNVLCHKVEELFGLAQSSGFQVSDDLDMVVTMATGFMSMLARRKPGQPTAAIDLDGFLEQIEEVLRETEHGRNSSPMLSIAHGTLTPSPYPTDRVSPPTQRRLAAVATSVFLEYLAASGRSRDRLRSVWLELCDHVTSFSSVPLQTRLARHELGATQLARDLHKQLEVVFDLAGERVSAEAAEAIDTLVLHAVRNAVDHGIELPEHRRAAGKRAQGRIQIRARANEGILVVEIEDDGRGVDFAAVRRRGQETGFISPGAANVASEQELLELLLHPGFSTQGEASPISGRGIGLDAARAGLAGVGGTLEVLTRAGQGTTVRALLPHVQSRIPVLKFAVRAGYLPIATSATWQVDHGSDGGAGEPVDPLRVLGLEDIADPRSPTVVVNLRRGERRVALVGAGPAEPCFAERICITDDDQIAEVVLLEGAEGVLLRPERV